MLNIRLLIDDIENKSKILIKNISERIQKTNLAEKVILKKICEEINNNSQNIQKSIKSVFPIIRSLVNRESLFSNNINQLAKLIKSHKFSQKVEKIIQDIKTIQNYQ